MQKHFNIALQVGRFLGESFGSVYTGWGTRERISQDFKQRSADKQFSKDLADAQVLAQDVCHKRSLAGIQSDDDICRWGLGVVDLALTAAGGSTLMVLSEITSSILLHRVHVMKVGILYRMRRRLQRSVLTFGPGKTMSGVWVLFVTIIMKPRL